MYISNVTPFCFVLFSLTLLFASSASAGPPRVLLPLRIGLEDAQRAARNLSVHLRPTPLTRSPVLSQRYGCTLYGKEDYRQPGKAFKVRGATNFFEEEVRRRQENGIHVQVTTASSGNHAQGVAFAAQKFGVTANIFMSEKTPRIKIENTMKLGANVILHGQSYDDAYRAARESAEGSGDLFVHPYLDPAVIAGQATVALELVEQLKTEGKMPDVIITPVGGGGLIAGIGTVIRGLGLSTQVIGVQPEALGSMARSFQAGKAVQLTLGETAQPTQADGVAVLKASPEIYEFLRYLEINDIETVPESAILEARLELIRLGMSVEAAGALPLALLRNPAFKERVSGKNVVLILSGGNFDDPLLLTE